MRSKQGFAAVVLGAAALLLSASSAAASVTLGQLAPTTGLGHCNPNDLVEPSVTSGPSYAAAGSGTITAWSTNAGANTGQRMTMKVFRKTSDPNTYAVVAHDGPRDLVQNTLNTFSTSIPVKAGDLIGLHPVTVATSTTYCDFPVTGDSYLFINNSDLADNSSAAFTDTQPNDRLNVSAVLVPSNAFSLGAVLRSKKHGTATLTVTLPGPGEFVVAGNGLTTSAPGALQSTAVAGPGDYQLTVRTTGKKKAKLNRKGKVAIAPTLTYTPAGGDASSQTTSIVLRLKKRR